MRARAAVALLAVAFAACAGTSQTGKPLQEALEASKEVRQWPFSVLADGATIDLTDARAFTVDDREIVLDRMSMYEPPFRSPRAIALLDEFEFRSFTLDVRMMQTGREYGHRDLCLVFGFESATRFYYVHLATTPDANAHNVFLVDGAPRRNLLPPQEKGVDWGESEWHEVRLVRDVDEGTVSVYFDDMETPVLEARDSTLEWGRIGFGSFDDTGRFFYPTVSRAQYRPVDPTGSPFSPFSPSDSAP